MESSRQQTALLKIQLADKLDLTSRLATQALMIHSYFG